MNFCLEEPNIKHFLFRDVNFWRQKGEKQSSPFQVKYKDPVSQMRMLNDDTDDDSHKDLSITAKHNVQALTSTQR